MTIKALLFDVFGTVVEWRTSICNDLEQWFTPLGITRDWDAFAQDWRALYQPAIKIELMVNMARYANLPWDMILGAEVARAYKPEPQAYLVSMDMLGLETCQCLMVAAHNEDLRQAASLGMKTAFISRPTEYGDRQTVDFAADDAWDFDCSSMIDLANRLRSL